MTNPTVAQAGDARGPQARFCTPFKTRPPQSQKAPELLSRFILCDTLHSMWILLGFILVSLRTSVFSKLFNSFLYLFFSVTFFWYYNYSLARKTLLQLDYFRGLPQFDYFRGLLG